jgi:hypothetical protein
VLVWIKLAMCFLRKLLKKSLQMDGEKKPSDDNRSHSLQQGELKRIRF